MSIKISIKVSLGRKYMEFFYFVISEVSLIFPKYSWKRY